MNAAVILADKVVTRPFPKEIVFSLWTAFVCSITAR